MNNKKKLFLEQRVIPLDRMTPQESQKAQLQPGRWPVEYKVTKVMQATSPRVSEVLSAEQVDEFCTSEEWEVTII